MNIQTNATGDSGELVTIMLTAATKWETSEVRKHILGLTALRYQRWQKRRGKWSVQDFKNWFAKVSLRGRWGRVIERALFNNPEIEE
jgi:hypothetical protein